MQHIIHDLHHLMKLYKLMERFFLKFKLVLEILTRNWKFLSNFKKYSRIAVFIKGYHVNHHWIPFTKLYKQMEIFSKFELVLEILMKNWKFWQIFKRIGDLYYINQKTSCYASLDFSFESLNYWDLFKIQKFWIFLFWIFLNKYLVSYLIGFLSLSSTTFWINL